MCDVYCLPPEFVHVYWFYVAHASKKWSILDVLLDVLVAAVVEVGNHAFDGADAHGVVAYDVYVFA